MRDWQNFCIQNWDDYRLLCDMLREYEKKNKHHRAISYLRGERAYWERFQNCPPEVSRQAAIRTTEAIARALARGKITL